MVGESIRKSKEDWLRDSYQYPAECIIGRKDSEPGDLQVLSPADVSDMIGGGGGGAVDSVNGQTGVVVLDTGDIADTLNKRYVTDANLIVINNTSGMNTGDQDLSGYLLSSTAASTYQPLDTDLTQIAAFSSTGIAVRTASNTWAQRSVVASSSKVTVTNPAGIAGNISIEANELAILDAIGNTQGDILYRTDKQWVVLPAGTDGDVLTTHDAGANPTWETPASGGGLSHPEIMARISARC